MKKIMRESQMLFVVAGPRMGNGRYSVLKIFLVCIFVPAWWLKSCFSC